MAASAMREDVMIRLSGRERLAVLLAVVVAALSLACAREVAEPTSTGMPNPESTEWTRMDGVRTVAGG